MYRGRRGRHANSTGPRVGVGPLSANIMSTFFKSMVRQSQENRNRTPPITLCGWFHDIFHRSCVTGAPGAEIPLQCHGAQRRGDPIGIYLGHGGVEGEPRCLRKCVRQCRGQCPGAASTCQMPCQTRTTVSHVQHETPHLSQHPLTTLAAC